MGAQDGKEEGTERGSYEDRLKETLSACCEHAAGLISLLPSCFILWIFIQTVMTIFQSWS